MSTPTNSANRDSTISVTAEVRLVSKRGWVVSDYTSVYVLVSSRIYWKAAKSSGSDKPQSLLDFRDVNSLRLTRLSEEEWNDENCTKKVKQIIGGERICISVPGSLHGPKQLTFFLLRNVFLEILVHQSARDELWNQIHSIIIPWRRFPQLIQNLKLPEPRTMPTSKVGESDKRVTILDEMQKEFSRLDDLIAAGTAGAGASATIVKLMTDEQCVKGLVCVVEVAERAADISRAAGGVGAAVFYLIKFATKTVKMCIEAERGRQMLPVALDQLVVLLRFVVEDIIEISSLSLSVREIDKKFVFDVLELLVCTMDTAETQLLRGGAAQIVKSKDVKEVEENLQKLLGKVAFVGYMTKTNRLSEKLEYVRRDLEYVSDIQRRDHERLDQVCDKQRRDHEKLDRFSEEQLQVRKELKNLSEKLEHFTEKLEQQTQSNQELQNSVWRVVTELSTTVMQHNAVILNEIQPREEN